MANPTIVERVTRETRIRLSLKVNGRGISKIETTYPFFDHMLLLFSCHGFFDLEISTRADIKVGYHHLLEDMGICLGKAFKEALRTKGGIRRYGSAFVPMDDVLTQCVIDISGRPFLVFKVPAHLSGNQVDIEGFEGFFRSFSSHSGITVHINVHYGRGVHHILESIFKAFAISLDEATLPEPRRKGVPSSKGRIDEI